MAKDQPLRIKQPENFRPLYVESFRRSARFGIRGFLVLGLFPSALVLCSLGLQTSDGQPVAAWQWSGAAGMGPFCILVVKVACWTYSAGDRFAEIRGNRVRLDPWGYTFHPSFLLYCKIEPDPNFPEVNHLCFCFRLFRFARPRYWTMMVENLDEAEEFRREIVERAT